MSALISSEEPVKVHGQARTYFGQELRQPFLSRLGEGLSGRNQHKKVIHKLGSRYPQEHFLPDLGGFASMAGDALPFSPPFFAKA